MLTGSSRRRGTRSQISEDTMRLLLFALAQLLAFSTWSSGLLAQGRSHEWSEQPKGAPPCSAFFSETHCLEGGSRDLYATHRQRHTDGESARPGVSYTHACKGRRRAPRLAG